MKKEILQNGKLENNVYFLPDVQLDRKEYLELAKHLEFIGGKWNRGKKGFVFDREITLEEIYGFNENKKKEVQFFATPEKLADFLVEQVEIENYHRVLEPSAGRGALLKAIHKVQPDIQIDYCEINDTNAKYLNELSGVRDMGMDFLKAELPEYDRIIANPPFSKNQDIDHIMKMYELLKEGGELISFSSQHWCESSNKKETAFREFLEEKERLGNAEKIEIKEGEFKESGTNIPTLILWIKK